jgi:2-polyprenyl-3-methyl-5-hydroxy-6-metoxy-1,4-benzoquinol methylase
MPSCPLQHAKTERQRHLNRDPIHLSQVLLRRAGQRLRRGGVVAEECFRHEQYDESQIEGVFENGERNIARLTPEIEALMGGTLESRRALDFGCGMGRTALPLARRFEHVYGLDVSTTVLREADRHAKRMDIHNVEWLEPEALEGLAGSYDLVFSMWVFQHIPSREGERIFATLVQGLRPGGVGVIHVSLRFAFDRIRRMALPDTYLLMNSYSLNRLARLLADHGVTEWSVKWHAPRVTPSATILFRKD